MTKTITQRVVENLRAHDRDVVGVLTHKGWGSQCLELYAQRRRDTMQGRWGAFKQQADTVVQHITVTLDHGPLTGDFAADCRTVEQIGLERFGSGVSYNWLVDMTAGMIAVGQPLDSKGTHTINDKGVPGYSYDQNLAARAIAVLGMPEDKLSMRAHRAITRLLTAMVEEGAVSRQFDYVPHSLFAYKDCPCDSTRDAMREIRLDVMDELAKGVKKWIPHTAGPR